MQQSILGNLSNRQKTAFFALIFGLIAIIIGFVVYKTNYEKPYGTEITIGNFDSKIKNLPADRKASISAYLYDTVKKNTNQSITIAEIGEATIRENSNSQIFNSEAKVFNGSFIVDIEKIKQSYKIEYVYSSDKNSDRLGGYEVLVLCLPSDKLIYGSFDCKELFEDSEGIDPIVTALPYSTLSYEIRYIDTGKDKATLAVRLFISEADRSIDEAAAVNNYKKEALDWLVSKGFKPDNYEIIYTY